MLFRSVGFSVEPYPVDFQESSRTRLNVLSFLPDDKAMERSSTAMREVIGLGFYFARGLMGK